MGYGSGNVYKHETRTYTTSDYQVTEHVYDCSKAALQKRKYTFV